MFAIVWSSLYSCFVRNFNTARVEYWKYDDLCNVVRKSGLSGACGIVDLDALDYNISFFKKRAELTKKKVRIATKSIRVPDLIEYIGIHGGEYFHSLMCYNIFEANLLSTYSIFNDILLAYPIYSENEVSLACEMNVRHLLNENLHPIHVTLMVDCKEHLDILSNTWRSFKDNLITSKKLNTIQEKELEQLKLRICIDFDMSYCLLGNRIHLGAHRSPIYNLNRFENIIKLIQEYDNLHLAGIMGYEAQISGLPSNNPFTRLMNPFIKVFQCISKRDVLYKRKKMIEILDKFNIHSIEFINGGGTGSFEWTMSDNSVTEVAVGSGFLQSSIFDWFNNTTRVPAFCFGIQCTRKPKYNMITCQSGGFIASGAISYDK